MNLPITIFGSVLGALAFYQVIQWLYLLYFHPLASYPGPRLARLTNFWRFRTFLKGQQHLVDQELRVRYGSFVRDGPESLLVSDVEAFKSIYGFTGKINKGDFYATASNGKPREPNVFAASTETLHRAARKKIVPIAFTPKHVAEYESSVTEGVYTFLLSLDQHLRAEGNTINIVPSCERLLFDTLFETIYGSSPGMLAEGDTAGIVRSKKKAFPFSFAIGHVPWLARILSLPSISAFFRRPVYDKEGRPQGLSAAAAWTRKVLGNATSGDAHLSPCVLKNFLQLDPRDGRRLSLEGIRYECFNFIFAGTGTTAAAIIAALYEIGLHPEWQSRLRAEIDRLPENEFPYTARLSTLASLQAILKEALRLHPPFVGPFERVIASGGETAVAGIKPLPAGTRVWSSLYVMCRSEEVFGEKVNDFRPDRWLDSTPEKLQDMNDVFCVFGRGKRRCLGQDLAWMILEKTVAAVIRKWHLSCDEEALKGKAFIEMHYDELRVTLAPRA